MNLRAPIAAAALATLAACGSTDTATTYTLTTGTYAVSGATANPADQCGLLPAFQAIGKAIDVAVVGTSVGFDLGQNGIAATIPYATLNGNSIEQPVEASYTANSGSCVLRIRRTVTGELNGNDDATLLMHATIADDGSGTACTIGDLPAGATAFPCTTDLHFLVRK